MKRTQAALAVTKKELRVAARSPLLVALSVIVPVVFVAIFALVIHTSATNPVAVASNSEGPYTDGFIHELRQVGSADGRFFSVVTTDSQEALDAFAARQVAGVIHIPESFDNDIATGETPVVTLDVFNIDSDVTKNLHLRLEHAVRSFSNGLHMQEGIQVQETSVFPRDIPMSQYFAGALLVFAVLYSSLVNTGTLFAREWEDRTAKGVVLSPAGFAPLIAGKWLASTVLTAGSFIVTAFLIDQLLDFPFWRVDALAAVGLGAVFLLGAALGSLMGIRFQSALLLVPASAVIAIAHLLLTGFESYLRGLAHEGILEWMWLAGSVWPVTALTDLLRAGIQEGLPETAVTGATPSALGWTGAIAVVATAVATRHLRRHLTFAQGM